MPLRLKLTKGWTSDSRRIYNLEYHIFEYGICGYGRQGEGAEGPEEEAVLRQLRADNTLRQEIGKTFLVLNAVSGCDFLYYLATERNNLKKFKEVVRGKYGEVKHVRGRETVPPPGGDKGLRGVWERSS